MQQLRMHSNDNDIPLDPKTEWLQRKGELRRLTCRRRDREQARQDKLEEQGMIPLFPWKPGRSKVDRLQSEIDELSRWLYRW